MAQARRSISTNFFVFVLQRSLHLNKLETERTLIAKLKFKHEKTRYKNHDEFKMDRMKNTCADALLIAFYTEIEYFQLMECPYN